MIITIKINIILPVIIIIFFLTAEEEDAQTISEHESAWRYGLTHAPAARQAGLRIRGERENDRREWNIQLD